MAHRRRERRDLGRGGESPPVRDDEDETQNRTMMSPTTALMLHSMNPSSLGGGGANDGGGKRGPAREGRARRPLGEMPRNVQSDGDVRRDPGPAAGRRPGGRGRHVGREDGRVRPREEDMGPNEARYRREYDGYVTSAIAEFAARSSTNLRRGGAALPDFGAMTAAGKVEALEGVDRLLERLSVSRAPSSGAAAPPGGGKRPALTVDVGARGEKDAFSYAAQHSGRSAGSETTMGHTCGGPLTSKSAGSETTMGNDRTAGSETTMGGGNDTTLLSGSVTTMGQGKTEQKPDSKSLGRSLLGRSLASHADRSVSLLGDSMALLSDDDGGEEDGGVAVPSPAPAVERARHASRPEDRRSRLELDDDEYDDEMARSPHPGRPSAKRSAADSGGRGLRSRHRPSHDGEVDDSLLGGGNGFGEDEYGDAVMFDGLGDDGGGFLSPIGRRSTFDGLDTPDGGGDGDGDEDGASRFSRLSERSDEDGMSFGDGGGGDLIDRDDGGCAVGTQRQSQWNAFENADARLTAGSQESDEDGDGDSPVRRRALRFDQTQTQRKGGGRGTAAREGRARAPGTDPVEGGGPGDDGGGDAGGDDDPIQTVNHLCRRARERRERNGDESNLEEVAPIDVRLRDGAHYRKDPLRCRQDVRLKSSMKDRTNRATGRDGTGGEAGMKKKSVTYKKKKKDGGGSDLSDPDEDGPPSFPDPTASFPGRIRARLDACHDFIVGRERCAPPDGAVITDRTAHPSCAVVSMTSRQIVAVASKLLVGTVGACRRRQRTRNGRSGSSGRFTPSSAAAGAPAGQSDHLAGGTLIVLRDRSDVATWTAALRESTSLSVLDHSGLAASVRKSAGTAANAAGFDAVLTTYDCLKAKEVTVPVDLAGRAMLGNSNGGGGGSSGDGGGWCTSRGSSQGRARPQKCHQLSVLHRLEWCRCVFVDVLGKKGYLIKPETARAIAATAVNSRTRVAFFESIEYVFLGSKKTEEDRKAREKFMEDRKQIKSLMVSLHLPDNLKLMDLSRHYLMDTAKVKAGDVDSSVDVSHLLEDSSSDEDDEIDD